MGEIISTDSSYRLLPLRFTRLEGESSRSVLLTGETGEHLFVSDSQLRELMEKRLQQGTLLYKDLLARHFIYEPGKHDPLPEMSLVAS